MCAASLLATAFDLIDDIFIRLSASYRAKAEDFKCADTNVCAEHLDSVCFTYCVVINIVYRYHMVHRSLPIMWRIGYFIQKAQCILEGKGRKIANSTG